MKRYLIIGVNFDRYAIAFPKFIAQNGSIPHENAKNQGFVLGNDVAIKGNYSVGENVTFAINIIQTDAENNTSKFYFYTNVISAILDPCGQSPFPDEPSDNNIYISNLYTSQITSQFDEIVVVFDNNTTNMTDNVNYLNKLFPLRISITQTQSIIGTINMIFSIITTFLESVAIICLFVAGFGILNIMFSAVNERVREIGILKSMGARNSNILGFFFMETIFIGLVGSVLGVVFGYGFASLVSYIVGLTVSKYDIAFEGIKLASDSVNIVPILSIPLIFETIAFGLVFTIVFGLYPSYRVLKMKTVDALRVVN